MHECYEHIHALARRNTRDGAQTSVDSRHGQTRIYQTLTPTVTVRLPACSGSSGDSFAACAAFAGWLWWGTLFGYCGVNSSSERGFNDMLEVCDVIVDPRQVNGFFFYALRVLGWGITL
jgi:hypothetical protein